VIAGFFAETFDAKGNPCTDVDKCSIGTAASNDLVVTPQAADTTPIPGAVWLFGSGIAGAAALLRRRKHKAAAGAAA
jgi:MYXO-CTERM domain-containing protein